MVRNDGLAQVEIQRKRQWDYHEDSSSALTDELVQAAPTAGECIYIEWLIFGTNAATGCSIFFESGTSTKILGPYSTEAVAGRGVAVWFPRPKKVPAATSLTVTTSAAIAHAIDMGGFIGPDA